MAGRLVTCKIGHNHLNANWAVGFSDEYQLSKPQPNEQCRAHVCRLLQLISRLQASQLGALQTLAKTLTQWSGPIAAMWRFSKNNGITEGFHRKMKLIPRRAYGFRNFNHYRLRVIAQCG